MCPSNFSYNGENASHDRMSAANIPSKREEKYSLYYAREYGIHFEYVFRFQISFQIDCMCEFKLLYEHATYITMTASPFHVIPLWIDTYIDT